MLARAFAVLGFVAAGFFGTASQVNAQVEVSLAHTNDAVYDVYLYGVTSGKVTSSSVRVKTFPMEISAQLAALGTKQFDLVDSAALIAAQAREKGLDALVVGTGGRVMSGRYVLVNKNSPITTVDQLKGKKLGVMSVPSTAVAHLRVVLSQKYKFNTSTTGGDINWIELPLPNLPTALLRNQVDAAFLFHTPLLKSMETGEFRILEDMTADFKSLFRTEPLVSIIVSYKSKVDEKGPALREGMRMLRASAIYAKNNPDEVYAAVGKARNIKPEDVKKLAEWYELRFGMEAADIEMLQGVWDMGAKMGIKTSNMQDMIWK